MATRTTFLLTCVLALGGCSALIDADPDRLGGDAAQPDAGTDARVDAPGCSMSCDDGIECTVDRCEGTVCTNTPDPTLCGDEERCTTDRGCVDARCDEDADCDDGNACNGIDRCEANLCVSGPAVVCDDGVACTRDVCQPETGECSATLDDAACDDSIPCTADSCTMMGCRNTPNDGLCDDGVCASGGRCDPTAGCVGGEVRDCDDEDDCTDDMCNPEGGDCVNTPADRDGDMVLCAMDCDDADASIGAAADETCNGRDDDCDELIDEDGVCTPDTCDEVQTIDLTADGEARVTGRFADYDDDYTSECGVEGGRDAVFMVMAPAGVDYVVEVRVSDGADSVLAASPECGTFEFAGRGCNDDIRPGGNLGSRIWVHNVLRPLFFLVDEYRGGGERAAFEVIARVVPRTGDTCESEFDITGGGTVVGNIAGGRLSGVRGTCETASGGAVGTEATFRFSTGRRARVDAEVWTESFRPVLYSRVSCDTAIDAACRQGAGNNAEISFTTDGRFADYSIIVDGRNPATGNGLYTLTYDIEP